MSAERPRPQDDDSGDLPGPGDAAGRPRRKDIKSLAEPATDVFASWTDPPPVRPQELRSKVWDQGASSAPEGATDEPSPRQETLPAMEPERPQPEISPPPQEPAPEEPGGVASAFSQFQARLEDVVRTRIDEAVAAAGRTLAASLGPTLSRARASAEETFRDTLRTEMASFAEEQGRLVRELREAVAEEQGRVVGELQEAVAGIKRALEELKPPSDAPAPATAVRLDEAFADLRQHVGEVGPELGRPLGELRDAVLTKLSADDQLRDAVGTLSERMAALEDRMVLAVEEPLRELRREVAHELRSLAASLEAGMADFARSQLARVIKALEEAVAAGREFAE